MRNLALVLLLPLRQAVHGVPGKAADALGDDQVDLSGQRVRDLEALVVLLQLSEACGRKRYRVGQQQHTLTST